MHCTRSGCRLYKSLQTCALVLQAISAEEIFESPEGQTFYRHVTLLASLLPHHCTLASAVLTRPLSKGICKPGRAASSRPAVHMSISAAIM